MIFGKKPLNSELHIELQPDEVPTFYAMLCAASLEQRRDFYRLKAYIEDEYLKHP